MLTNTPLFRAALSACAASACTYPTLSPHVGEGTRVLRRGQVGVAITAAGGGGTHSISGNNASSVGGGVEARVRVGLPGDQELGVKIGAGISSKTTGDPPILFGGALSYKIAPRPWLALIADLGAMDKAISSTAIFGGSLAAIVAPYTTGNTQLYTGLKGSFSIPKLSDASGTAEVVTLPVGLAWQASEHTQLVFEAGGFYGASSVDAGGTKTSSSGVAGYGLLSYGHAF